MAPPVSVVSEDECIAAETKPQKTDATSDSGSSKTDSKDASVLGKLKGAKSDVQPVAHVDEKTVHEIERVQEAEINSRCCELTISPLPLADVSEAFEHGSNGIPTETKVEMAQVETPVSDHSTTDPESFVRSRAPSPSSPSKCIDHSFTFSTPSKSGERYRRARGITISSEL